MKAALATGTDQFPQPEFNWASYPLPHGRGSEARYRTPTVRTYVVMFVSILSKYFYRPAFRSMCTGLRRGLLDGSTLAFARTPLPHGHGSVILSSGRALPSPDRKGVGVMLV
jgi:hypothetical protein